MRLKIPIVFSADCHVFTQSRQLAHEIDDRRIARRLGLLASTLDQLFVHIHYLQGVHHNLVPFIMFLSVINVDVLTHFLNLLLDRLASSFVLFG